MVNYELIREVIFISFFSSIICISFVLKIKECFPVKYNNIHILISILVSVSIGTLFSLTFSNLNIIYSMWCGLFSFIFTDLLHKILQYKVFKYFTVIDNEDKA